MEIRATGGASPKLTFDSSFHNEKAPLLAQAELLRGLYA